MATESEWHRLFKQSIVKYLSEEGYETAAEHTLSIGYAKRRADVALPQHKIAIELWSSRYGPNRARVEERRAALLVAGWMILDVPAGSDRACLMYVRKDVEELAAIQARDDSPAQIAREKGLPDSPYEASRRYIYLYNLYHPTEYQEGL